MFELIDQLLANLNLRVCESVDVPARPESRGQVPKTIAEGPAFSVLNDMIPSGQVWTHQAEALKHLCDGRNVVVSTGTASGKSLIFQIYALHHLLTDPDSKILVFYPLRTLTNDQLVSWQKLAESAGLEPEAVGRIYGGASMNERKQIIGRSRIVYHGMDPRTDDHHTYPNDLSCDNCRPNPSGHPGVQPVPMEALDRRGWRLPGRQARGPHLREPG